MKNKRLWAKIIFVAVLICIIIYTFRGSWRSILQQIASTTPQILALIAGATVVYHLIEAWITYSLAKLYRPGFHYRNAVYNAFYCSFYRLSTLGSGSGVAAIVYLGKHGVGYAEATGMYTIQYIIHKVSIAIFSGVSFLFNWRVMASHYKNYAVYLILAYILTAAICLLFVLLLIYPGFHRLILSLARKLNRSHKHDGLIRRLEDSIVILEHSSGTLLRNWGKIVTSILKNMLKLCVWYSIPFLILYKTGEISFLSSLSITSLSVMTAGVIPTPAGIGSTELIMTGLFSLMMDVHKAAAVTLLYRIATFILPFVIGAGLILGNRVRRYILDQREKSGCGNPWVS
ncbi:MAG: lysylphosphatidylglycerol synthase domain-containing protein [Clostridiales bacterium]|nr:lysylphosphatidylglycerol synthase domain-containing protein [Clostridiales bacterium]